MLYWIDQSDFYIEFNSILLQFAVWIKRKTSDNQSLSEVFVVLLFV